MRWTNYFVHPADNRYHVFSFREEAQAAEFEARLKDGNIAYEAHQEGGEWMFAVARTFFKEALRHNHLVHAAHRTPFIPVEGLRWALLVFTGVLVGLALWGWLTANRAVAQEMPWELDALGRVHVPVAAMGVRPVSMANEGLTANWYPKVGSDFGLRINRRLKDGWCVAGGLEWVRREHLVVASMAIDSLGISTTDTLPQLRSLSYRLPLLGGYRLALGWDTWEVTAGVGLALEWRTSETSEVVSVFDEGGSRQLEAYSGRSRYLAFPILAEFGFQRPAEEDRLGWYVGWHWSSPLGRTTWAETVWRDNSLGSKARNYLHHSVAALDVRIIFPE